MENKKVSIIIPVYNIEKYIIYSLLSIINQSYSNIEIIIIDDGSTDNSGKICDIFSKIDNRISVYHIKNKGLSNARNLGIEKSKGELLAFIDGDDIVSNDYIQLLLYNMINDNSDISIIEHTNVETYNKAIFKNGKKHIVYSNIDKAICDLLYQKKFLVSAWGKLFKKELFKDIKFPNGMLYEDSAIMYKLFEQAKKISYSNSKEYGYVHRENSITNRKFDNKNFDILIISKEILNRYYSNKKIRKAALSYYVNANMRIYLNIPDGEFKEYKSNCYNEIKKYGIICLLNMKTRIKLKVSILLFYFSKKKLRIIYKKTNRWS